MHELKLDPIQIKLQRLKSNTSYIFTVFFLSFKKNKITSYIMYIKLLHLTISLSFNAFPKIQLKDLCIHEEGSLFSPSLKLFSHSLLNHVRKPMSNLPLERKIYTRI